MNSDDFVFDNQMLGQVIAHGYAIGEVSCPTAYFADASSISFWRSVRYGLGVLRVSLATFLYKRGWSRAEIFDPDGRKLDGDGPPRSDGPA